MAVFHLKYRSKKVSELDLPEVAKTLKIILASMDRPQCFLFAGPKGSGKTSAARILARAINCLKPVGVEPCGECVNCKEILLGASIDVVEIDGASNRGIDDVRLLRERAYLLPSKLAIKVFIIDEVHMLTKDAFNAFLKLIEEPPAHTVFIMCTTDPQKIPETVLSRLLRVDFRKGGREELLRSLGRVIKGEKIKIGAKARDLIVSKSDGSFRNLHLTFNEVFMECGKKVSLADVKKYFVARMGTYDGEDLERDLVTGKTKAILTKLEEMAAGGVDFAALRCQYLEYFQKRLLANFGVGEARGELSLADLQGFLFLLVEAGRWEKDVEIAQLPLELAVVKFLGLVEDLKVVEIEEKTEIKRVKVREIKKEEPRLDSPSASLGTSNGVKNGKGLTVDTIEERWTEVLAAIKPFNHSVEAFMRSTRPKLVEGQVLTLEVFYPFHKEKLEEDKNRKMVEEGLSKVFGCEVFLKCVLSSGGKKPLVVSNDTPREAVAEGLSEEKEEDIYDVAKEIFG